MPYLKSFTLPTDNDETDYKLSSASSRLNMQCYSGNAYPFGIFPFKELSHIEFDPITIFYGGNGSGKTTLLNVIAEKLKIDRTSPFNHSPCFEDYLGLCQYELSFGKYPPRDSHIITSDDVFDFMLDVRAINQGLDRRREEIFAEYRDTRDSTYRMTSLSDYEELRRNNEARRSTKSAYTARRIKKDLQIGSNGENAYLYFTDKIKENALYLLDEPENSLSAKMQSELAKFIENSARFYGCQFIISSHSPFILSIKDAKTYDLDTTPATPRHWTDLENVRTYYDFFQKHKNEFT